MKIEYENLSPREKVRILEEEGTLLSADEWDEIYRRWDSPLGHIIGAFASRIPRINKRSDGAGLCKLRKPTPGYLWNGLDSELACQVDEIIRNKAKHGGLCR